MAGKPDELWCPKLSLEDTTALKAAAMFLIVAHNFLHNIQPISQENEFVFHILTGHLFFAGAVPRTIFQD